jgi:mannose/cellobiose epimerase-like protein (N-acyl-D-glucosamine 2-epimerase family)
VTQQSFPAAASSTKAPQNAIETEFLAEQAERLWAFAERGAHPDGGFGHLDADGQVDLARPTQTYVTCRMVHSFALAQISGRPGAAELVTHGLAALDRGGLLHDEDHGGWFTAVQPRQGEPGTDMAKAAYTTAFVVLASSSALIAGHAAAERILAEALSIVHERFWDEEAGLVRDSFDRAFSTCDAYRGVNANMHMVEALLSAADATGQDRWREQAGRILSRVVDGFARSAGWRLPEHYDDQWRPRPGYNHEQPAHPFRPYGVTPGHGLEWARLTLHHRAALRAAGRPAPEWLLDSARCLFDVAVADGWCVDGADGFIYTTDHAGRPVVSARLHWVLTEAIGAAGALHIATGEECYRAWHELWWRHAEEVFIDRQRGSWHHELDSSNHIAATTWSGKPDIYHALQATFVARLPLAPTFALALQRQRDAAPGPESAVREDQADPTQVAGARVRGFTSTSARRAD